MNRTKIIYTLCGSENNIMEYSICKGLLYSKCQHDMYCDIKNLSDNQVAYILSDINSDIYLNACPGSGKTEVIGVKCAYEMTIWKNTIGGLAILTFTNSAENELRERVVAYYRKQPGYPHFLGTFTSWLHGYIANPFLYLITDYGKNGVSDTKLQVIDSDCNGQFLKAFKTKYSYNGLHKLSANEYFFNQKKNKYQYCGKLANKTVDFDVVLNDEKYKIIDLKDTKRKFWEAGFFLYEDVEFLSYKLLNIYPKIADLIAKRFPLIIVDECQDLSYIQLLILEILHNHGSIVHLIGDLNQAIYEFRDIEPKDTQKFIRENHLKEMTLNENYRSNQFIVDASGKLINSVNTIYGKIPQHSCKPLIAFLYRQDQENKMIQKYIQIINMEQLQIENCRIIVRNNALRKKICGEHETSHKSINIIEDYAHFIYLMKKNTVTEFQNSVQFLARAIGNSIFFDKPLENKINLYKPTDIEMSDWINIILCVQRALLSDDQLLNLNQIWGTWKAVLKDCLSGISYELNTRFNLKKLRNNIKDNLVIETFGNNQVSINNQGLFIETIHGCKGMNLESVLFVSAYKKSSESSSYWKNWFPGNNQTVGESQRLAYVAFSRAEHILAIGIPNPQNSPVSLEDITMLKSIGFSIFDCDADTWLE
jgi:DNA helicase-2/ATP-dependent DNA helicase PcrA